MAKFSGVIGFITTSETAPGVYTPVVEEKDYIGDFLRNARNWQEGQSINSDLALNTRISIVADPYLTSNVSYIRYVKFDGAAWKVTNVEFQRPRLILTMGGVYNG